MIQKLMEATLSFIIYKDQLCAANLKHYKSKPNTTTKIKS
jgi:hypothetical protein